MAVKLIKQASTAAYKGLLATFMAAIIILITSLFLPVGISVLYDLAGIVPFAYYRAELNFSHGHEDIRRAGCLTEYANKLASDALERIVQYESVETFGQCMARARKEGRLEQAI